jgi:hypothetical protein
MTSCLLKAEQLLLFKKSISYTSSNANDFAQAAGRSLLQRDSTRFFQAQLRLPLNACASLGTEPADVSYAITGERIDGYLAD